MPQLYREALQCDCYTHNFVDEVVIVWGIVKFKWLQLMLCVLYILRSAMIGRLTLWFYNN